MRMAASSAKRNGDLSKMLAFALLFVASLSKTGVMAQDDEIAAATAPVLEAQARGDMIIKTTETPEPEDSQGQILVLPTMKESTDETTAMTTGGDVTQADSSTAADQGSYLTTNKPESVKVQTLPPMPPRGDGPGNKPKVSVPKDNVVCVSKEAIQDKNAVNLKLKASSNCRDTRLKIESVLQELCSEDCKLELYQEDGSDEIIVSGKYVEADVTGMANKFNNDNIKDKTDVEEAVPRWGKNSKLVLVSLLLTGLLLAALLVAGYYLKTHRKTSKGVRLAESFQVDEENQANTLVSVAPLPQEPLDKPTTNGESTPENGTNPTPTTNGHSQTPVADTEM